VVAATGPREFTEDGSGDEKRGPSLLGRKVDVSREKEVQTLVDQTVSRLRPESTPGQQRGHLAQAPGGRSRIMGNVDRRNGTGSWE